MYKLLVFVKKNKEEKIIDHFKNYTLKYLSETAGKEIKLGEVESSLLLEQKYSHFCEFGTETKAEMDQLMSSGAGKQLNNDLTDFHQNIDIIFVDFN
jgi:hypothetical protein